MKLVLTIAALIGCALGATLVLAGEPAPSRVAAVSAAATPGETNPPVQAIGTTVALQVDDPQGGPAWAVRTFTDPGRDRCAEIDRVVDGKYGWIDGHGAFRVATAGRHVAPDTCSTASTSARLGTDPMTFSTVAYAADAAPEAARTITWGIAAPDVTSLASGGLTLTPRDGVYLVVTAPDERETVRGTITRTDGRTERFDSARGLPPAPTGLHVGVVAADPAGGLPWVILDKGACHGIAGRALGNQLGEIDPEYDIFSATYAMFGCQRAERRPTRAYPLRLDAGISTGFPQDAQGTTERRVLPGRTAISGAVAPDVVSVTIATPHDVRTLIPSHDHLVLAVYDGTFPTGGVTATARLGDGRTFTRSVYVG